MRVDDVVTDLEARDWGLDAVEVGYCRLVCYLLLD
jgi:hypothetical protein